tara:strand:+ start:144 stop:1331 length:1188 start_codon:yes stop_codon:yes gene_type:complete
MNDTFQKINDIYVLYTLNGYDKKKIPTKLSYNTINRYINLMEKLDIRLFQYFDNKDKKLTISNADKLIKFYNPEFQYHIFMNNQKITNSIIQENSICYICCNEKSYNMIITPCCGKNICESCLIEYFKGKMFDIKFNIMKCLFCNKIFSFRYIRWLMKDRLLNREEWMKRKDYIQNINYSQYELFNILFRYNFILSRIEKQQSTNIHINDQNLECLPKMIEGKIYGPCPECTPRILKNRKQRPYIWNDIKVKGINAECANAEGDEIVIKKEMFLCQECDVPEEIKKCPHCGVRTIKPNDCKFIFCQCGNHWCFLCGCRLINNQDGHNRHYHIGPGSGPYGNSCRHLTNDIKRPTFELLNCDCNHCSQREGLSLCLDLDCNKTAIYGKHYCEIHLS